MNSYRYKVTVEMVAEQRGEPVQGKSLSFEAPNHDDVLSIVERVQARWHYPPEELAAMAIGFKLLAEVALVHRNDALFAELRPALKEFIHKVKQGPAWSLFLL